MIYVWKDTGEPIPNFEEVQAALGPALCQLIERRLKQMLASTCVTEVLGTAGFIQGVYASACALGMLDERMGNEYNKQVAIKSQERLAAITGRPVGLHHVDGKDGKAVH